jgi:hypothetical protein
LNRHKTRLNGRVAEIKFPSVRAFATLAENLLRVVGGNAQGAGNGSVTIPAFVLTVISRSILKIARLSLAAFGAKKQFISRSALK